MLSFAFLSLVNVLMLSFSPPSLHFIADLSAFHADSEQAYMQLPFIHSYLLAFPVDSSCSLATPIWELNPTLIFYV